MKKVQISASLRPNIQSEVADEAKRCGYHFSEMVDVLLEEAIKARKEQSKTEK